MSEEQKQSPEEKAAIVLKEVNKKVEDSPESHKPNNDQPSAGEAAEQLKGSDADIDQSIGYDDQPDVKEAQKQVEGSDADLDQD